MSKHINLIPTGKPDNRTIEKNKAADELYEAIQAVKRRMVKKYGLDQNIFSGGKENTR